MNRIIVIFFDVLIIWVLCFIGLHVGLLGVLTLDLIYGKEVGMGGLAGFTSPVLIMPALATIWFLGSKRSLVLHSPMDLRFKKVLKLAFMITLGYFLLVVLWFFVIPSVYSSLFGY